MAETPIFFQKIEMTDWLTDPSREIALCANLVQIYTVQTLSNVDFCVFFNWC